MVSIPADKCGRDTQIYRFVVTGDVRYKIMQRSDTHFCQMATIAFVHGFSRNKV